MSTSKTLFASGYGGQIHTLSFTPSTCSLSLNSSTPSGSAPTWLYQHPSLPILYTGDEFSKPHGTLSAYKIDQQTMTLNLLEGQGGAKTKEGPVHFVTSRDGRQLFSACYAAGALSTTKLRRDGGFATGEEGEEEEGGVKGQNFVFGGKGVNPDRQEAPHAHGVALDPTGQYLFCTDLGTDQVHIYRVSPSRIDLSISFSTPKGNGPRHLVFSQNPSLSRTLVYLIEELSNTISIYSLEYPHPPLVEEAYPTIQPVQLNISILPPSHQEIKGDWTAAELSLSKDARLLYTTNRAPQVEGVERDWMTILSLDEEGRILESENEYVELGGVGPRHFELTKDQEEEGEEVYMAIAFQRTNEVRVYRVEGKEVKEVAQLGGLEGVTCVVWR